MRNTAISEIERYAENNDHIFIMTADLGYNVLEQFANKYPDRFINVGISEQFMASAAAGLALSGNTVFTYSIGNFATLRCIEQIRNDICYHDANVKILAVGGGFAYGRLGMSHHATEDIAMMRSLPNMRVFTPADPGEAAAVVRYALEISGPCYIRLARNGEPNLYHKDNSIDISRVQTILDGKDAGLIACGPILGEAIAAADALKKSQIDLGVFSVPCIKPIERNAIEKIGERYPMLFTLEEHNVIGGLGSAVAEILSTSKKKHGYFCPLGLQDVYSEVVGSHEYLSSYYGLSAEKIAGRIIRHLHNEGE